MRIVGGLPASIQDFPYIATIRSWNPEKRWFYCAGGIISDQWILTVAQCMPTRWNEFIAAVPVLQVAVGVDDKNKFRDNMVQVHSFISHEDYNKSTWANDIALIRLAKKLEFGSKMRKVILPHKDQAYDYTGQDWKATLAGFGMEKENTKESQFLNIVSFGILANADCAHMPYINKHQHLCAGTLDGSRDTCYGDSGSPLVVQAKSGEDPTVLGLVSYGYGCGVRGYPTLYTRVSNYLDWINREMKVVDDNATLVFGEP